MTDAVTSVTPAPGGQGAPRLGPQDARRVAEEFEATFLAQMLSSMGSGLRGDGLLLGDASGDPYRQMLHQELGKLISRAGGVGVADAILQEMLKLQEVA